MGQLLGNNPVERAIQADVLREQHSGSDALPRHANALRGVAATLLPVQFLSGNYPLTGHSGPEKTPSFLRLFSENSDGTAKIARMWALLRRVPLQVAHWTV
jgi:hypothetical protein